MKQHPANYIRDELKGIYSLSEAKHLAHIVLHEVTGLSAANIAICKDTELSQIDRQKVKDIVARLKNFEPYQYIFGHIDFFGLSFHVNSAVLIPRPETEELVEWMLSEIVPSSQTQILDIGTGSGCIAITLAKNLPSISILACDISPEALVTAKKNAATNNVQVHFFEADILQKKILPKKVDIIVSNPPYITESEKAEMERNVLDFEPHKALFVPDDDAVLFYQHIIEFATTNLIKGGMIFFEINRSKSNEIKELLTKNSFCDIEIRKDISGNPRMIRARKGCTEHE